MTDTAAERRVRRSRSVIARGPVGGVTLTLALALTALAPLSLSAQGRPGGEGGIGEGLSARARPSGGRGGAAARGSGRVDSPVRAPLGGRGTSSAPEQAWFVVESGPVSFGDLNPGEERDLPSAIRVRVFSSRDWILRVVPGSPLLVADRGEGVPLSRLRWRSDSSGQFLPINQAVPLAVARGSKTSGAGQLVVVDLKMHLEPTDPLGRYSCNFRLLLEVM